MTSSTHDSEPTPEELKAKALKLLGVKARSRDELAGRLLSAGGHSRAVEEVLDRLEEVGLLNDLDYAAQVIDRAMAKGHAVERMRRELLYKGVTAAVIEDALATRSERSGGRVIGFSRVGPGRDADGDAEEENWGDGVPSELERATALALKKVRSVARHRRQTAYQRTAGFLFQRGFQPDIVAEATRQALSVVEVD
ncbi:MAG: regulatory protein RecX [Actinomycetota bacterium]|nr:recombination regulator RecX [Actinomycetota bacterium]